MMILVTLFQTTEYRDGTHLVRFIHHDCLESAFQCLILLEIFLIFVQCGGTDGAKFATGKCWLEDVCGIHSAFSAAGSYEGVDFIYEENDSSLGSSDF